MCLLPQRTAIINSNLQIFTKNMSQAWYNHQNTRQLVPNCDYSEFQVQLIIDDDRFEVPFSKFYAEPYTMEKNVHCAISANPISQKPYHLKPAVVSIIVSQLFDKTLDDDAVGCNIFLNENV